MLGCIVVVACIFSSLDSRLLVRFFFFEAYFEGHGLALLLLLFFVCWTQIP